MTELLYAGAGMLMVGLGAGFVFMLFEIADESVIAAFVAALIGSPLIAGLGYVMFAGIAQRESPDLATLKKGEWACTAAHSEAVTTYVQSGKVLVPIVTSQRVCDAYGRIR